MKTPTIRTMWNGAAYLVAFIGFFTFLYLGNNMQTYAQMPCGTSICASGYQEQCDYDGIGWCVPILGQEPDEHCAEIGLDGTIQDICQGGGGGCVPNAGDACTSGSNSCGMTSSGSYDCAGNCSATTPDESYCPAPETCPGAWSEGGFQNWGNEEGPVGGACPEPTCADYGQLGTYPDCYNPPPPTCADSGQLGTWPDCYTDPGCTPDNSCTASTCSDSTCGDACGNTYWGAVDCTPTCTPDSSCAANTCTGDTCSDGCGGLVAGTMDCTPPGPPNLTQPNISFTPSAGFDLTTGNYNQITVNFQTSNNGDSDAGASSYFLHFDPNGVAGIDRTGNLAAIAVGGIRSGTQSFSGIPFGPISIRVLVDSSNVVAESNENDNERVLNAMLQAPDPNITLEVDRDRARTGEQVTLSWNTRATYPMNCVVVGPGIAPVIFNPRVEGPTGSQQSAPLNAKSEFTLRCTEPITNTVFTDVTIVEVIGTLEET